MSYLDGTAAEPQSPVPPDELEIWKTNNAKVFSWIINSVEPRIALTLRTFTSAAAIWIHLKKLYAKANSSRRFDIEYELAKLTQGDRDINTFYTIALELWTEQDLLSMSMLSAVASDEVLAERRRTRVLQFLMKLRPEFESVRSQAILQNVTDMDDVLGDLLRVETRLQTQAQLDGVVSSTEMGTVFAAGRRPQFYASSNRTNPSGSFGGSNRTNTTGSYGGSNRTNSSGSMGSSSRPPIGDMKCRHCQVI
ncbi:hypothetical protein LINPERPRIM_LOCUS22648 [Linum perenne]